MNIKYFYSTLLILAFSCSPKATIKQEDNLDKGPVSLLTIGNEDIYADEFLNILSKNRTFQNKEELISKEEFEDNFNLFVNFKLKVKEAENEGLDELDEFQKEFSMFKEDLIRPFLIKNSLQEGELMKAYNRMQEVIKASHILLQFPSNANREDSVAVFRMAEKLKSEAENGADFNELAFEHSDDPSAKDNKGNLGYFTALQMVYQFEDAAYRLQTGEISDPISTEYGYHLIKLEDRKPNPGEIKVSHILIRTQSNDPVVEERALRKVGDIYSELQKPESVWEDVCTLYSEDMGTKNSGGKLPWISVGSVIPEFERVAFNLSELGEISSPVKTQYGYHIIRLEDKKPIAPYEEMEEMIKSKILRDSRSTLIQSQVIAIQKSRYSFQENEKLIDSLNQIFKSAPRKEAFEKIDAKSWKEDMLISMQGKEKSVSDLLIFMNSNDQIVRLGNKEYFNAWYDKFVEVNLNDTEEKDLEANNKDYQMILKEYRDGILIFSLMNQKVWQKALEDSLGQIAYFEANREKYQWSDRYEALIVKMGKDSRKDAVKRFLIDKKYQNNLETRLENTFLNDDPLAFTIQNNIFEINSHPVLSRITTNNTFQEISIDGKTHFVILGKKIPAGPKKFEETRGKVIQDYQEYLDKSMVTTLKENYIIRINEEEKNRVYEVVTKK
ncbi:peptidyl-prolyl cis-trans isomerase [Belliella sp. R4-6]|uniref:Peptidyl-prolyl cis-trans isomerase n=1 Tax=Belliella alkalica TaxID=1730871 RepID=A0ABS9VDP4_9BACT|nr:peptidylprolyl isomerase [Belliella alkalica]MCH7414008.1 peptidyl-prolyl cis-trans isomerase [Belliella alkalica]